MLFKERLDFAYEYTPKCETLLDIGCDYGDFANKYLKKAKKVYAVDPNKKVIEIAKKRYKKVNFVVSPAEKLPFKDSFFDVITMTDSFEHVLDEKQTMKEVYRVLKPNGTLIFSVPYKGMFACLDAFNMKFYFPRFYKWFKGKEFNPNIYEEAPWHRHYNLKELNAFFKGKFEIQEKHRGGLFVFPFCHILFSSIFWMFPNAPKIFSSLNGFLARVDYSISYGPLSYHIVLRAKSLKKK